MSSCDRTLSSPTAVFVETRAFLKMLALCACSLLSLLSQLKYGDIFGSTRPDSGNKSEFSRFHPPRKWFFSMANSGNSYIYNTLALPSICKACQVVMILMRTKHLSLFRAGPFRHSRHRPSPRSIATVTPQRTLTHPACTASAVPRWSQFTKHDDAESVVNHIQLLDATGSHA